MAKSQLEIVVIDENGPTPFDQPAQFHGAGAGDAPAAPPPPRAGEPVRGPRRRQEDDQSVLGALGGLGRLGAEALGLGGLLGASLKLAKAFAELFGAVMRSVQAHQQEASVVAPKSRKTRPGEIETIDITGPEPSPKPSGPKRSGPDIVRGGKDDVIEGEFEVKGPPASSSRALSVPRAPALRGPVPPPSSRVETVGVQETVSGLPAVARPPIVGPPAAAGAVTGPSAGAEAGSAASGLARVAAAAAPAALAFAAIAAAVIAPIYLLKKAFDILGPQVQKLEGFSGPLAAATGQSEVRMELAEIRRAQRIGPDLARFERTRGRLEEATHDLWTAVLEVLLRLVNKAEPSLDLLIKGMGIVEVSIPVIAEAVTLIANSYSFDVKAAIESNQRLARLLQQLPFEIAKELTEDMDPAEPIWMSTFTSLLATSRAGLPEPWLGVAPTFPGGRFPRPDEIP